MSKRKTGFSLLELTVATAIYSMGLGSLSLMMMVAVHGTTEARHETVATAYAASLAELILMNPGAVGHYIGDAGGEAASNLQTWRDGLAEVLPAASGLICQDGSPGDGTPDDAACDGAGQPVIKVFWKAPEKEDEPGSGSGRKVARLPVP
jgi:type IV pilus assembly protein PilV